VHGIVAAKVLTNPVAVLSKAVVYNGGREEHVVRPKEAFDRLMAELVIVDTVVHREVQHATNY